MLISVGILAWNEERVIEGMLRSLFRQNLLTGTGKFGSAYSLEVVVVANGCSDGTGPMATRVIDSELLRLDKERLSGRVVHLAEAGKSNAWNHYVHEIAARDAEFIFLADADIEFGQPECLSSMLQALLGDPKAQVSVDLPLKDALKKNKRSLLERISVAASGQALSGPAALSGQLYCARAAALRRIWMPKGMSVEDGFIGAMIRTDCMLVDEDESRIIRAPGATHYFETLLDVRAIFHHELRLVMGTALNCYLLWDFLLYATDPAGSGAGCLVRNLITKDPDWYRKFIANSIRNRGWWVLPRGMLFRRFAGIVGKGQHGRARRYAMATVGFAVDLPVFMIANHRLKKNTSIGYW